MTASPQSAAPRRSPAGPSGAGVRPLPNARYTDPALHDRECAALIAGTWAGIGVAAEVPEPGCVLPLDFLGVPLLLLRGRDGAVRVFQNVCRHRGMILVDAPRRIEGALRCPYHSWCYALDGRLVATPHVGGPGRNLHPAIDRAALGLIEVRARVWRDVVFVNLSGDAPPFETAMAPALARLEGLDAPLHHGGAASRFVLAPACNWKLAVENFCESYHLPWVHPGLNAYSRLEDHYDIVEPGAFSGQGTRAYAPPAPAAGGRALPDFPALPEALRAGAEYLALFPNVLLGLHRDHAFAIVLTPLGVAATREAVHLYYAAPDTDPALRARNAALWRTVFEEDIAVVEGMQRGRAAPGFDGGVLSPAMEAATACFHAWAAERFRDGTA